MGLGFRAKSCSWGYRARRVYWCDFGVTVVLCELCYKDSTRQVSPRFYKHHDKVYSSDP